MTKVLILGAGGKIAQIAEELYLDQTDFDLRLYLRHPNKLSIEESDRVEIVEGDASDKNSLSNALNGVDIVYANLAGDNIEEQAKSVVESMNNSGVKRLIWISTLGIYDEVPGEFGKWNNNILGSYITKYAAAAKVIEESDLEYTIIRPAWLTNNDEVNFEVTHRDDTFKGTEVSRKSIAQVVVDTTKKPSDYVRDSIGVNKPNTDGDKPSWY
ncbi:SDR family oxidoreductase [Lactobacillus terrae]|uniref:SDR family oxidoreductase n=1 Tax=Lactobacillus terrae TaxID=2269374 RepID=UPI000C1B6534|nr:SDR family oxidoreductase [Lactobacillus terrae]